MFLSGYKGTWNYSNLNGSQFGLFLKGCVFGTTQKISYFYSQNCPRNDVWQKVYTYQYYK